MEIYFVMKQPKYLLRLCFAIIVLVSCHSQRPVLSPLGSSLQGTETSIPAEACGLFNDFVKSSPIEPVFSKETTLFGTEI